MPFEPIASNSAERREVPRSSALLPLPILLCFCTGLIAGCGGIVTPSTSGAPGAALSASYLAGSSRWPVQRFICMRRVLLGTAPLQSPC